MPTEFDPRPTSERQPHIVLENPRSDFVIEIGNGGSGGARRSHTHVQSSASDTWVVNHNLNAVPAVTIIDSAGTEVEGEVTHTTPNQSVLRFNAPFSGTARFI